MPAAPFFDGTAPPALSLPRQIPPSNNEAEQALLGALLVSNKAVGRVSEFLRPEHFADAVHGRIYQAICELVDLGVNNIASRSAAAVPLMYATTLLPFALGFGILFRGGIRLGFYRSMLAIRPAH